MKENFKIFIVDDDSYFSNLYKQHLLNSEYTDVHCFDNGRDCLKNLSLQPDIIFLDYNMDDMNGFEVLKKIKRYDPNVFIVMISAQEEISIAVNSLKYGSFDYIIKNNSICDSIDTVIEKIIMVKEELKKANPTFIQKILSKF
jgi:DNA-binding NtrC family response regulator